MLHSQDVLVTLRLLQSMGKSKPTLQDLSVELGISASQIHAAIRRAARCHLLEEKSREVNRTNLKEFLAHGIKYVFPAELSEASRGVPTSIAAAPLREHFSLGNEALLPVWPHPDGTAVGLALKPLHPAAPGAALKNPVLHEWLALVDAVRAGRARERSFAVKELERRLSS